jgi:Flp pilus assembly protein TadG
VTAEFAVALPILVVVMAAGMAAVAIVGAQLRCIDAAREAARATARGESIATARQAALEAAPAGARVVVSVQGDRVFVAVSANVRFPAGLVPAITVDARVVGRAEPGLLAAPETRAAGVAAGMSTGGAAGLPTGRWVTG